MKGFLMNVLLISALCIGLSLLQDLPMMEPCHCGVFDAGEEPVGESKLQFGIPIDDLPCDDEGRSKCNDACTEMARSTEEEHGSVICTAIKDSDGYNATLYYKVCDDTAWLDTGLSKSALICCSDGQQINC